MITFIANPESSTMRRAAHLFYVAGLFGIALLSGCTKRNPLYCATNSECMSSAAPICDATMSSCRGCLDRDDCAALPSAASAPACIAGGCVECGRQDDCMHAANRPMCDLNDHKCRKCDVGPECAARDSNTPVCLASGGCVECAKDSDCKGADKPICDVNSHSCQPCGTNTECAAVAAATPVCSATGACLGCATHADCSVAEKPICDQTTSTCRGCQAAADCAAAGQVCSATGRCIECETNTDCKVASKPICSVGTNTCRGCQTDTECPSEPGVCMAHIDGHCAIASETIYVSDDKTGTCGDTVAIAGTITNPTCTLQAGIELVSATRRLVLVRGAVPAGDARVVNAASFVESIVGQKQASVMALGPALTLSTGALYVRDLRFGSAYNNALTATGGTLRLDHVLIDSNAGGGIVLDGAAFDIRNTTVTNSGPGAYGNGSAPVGGIFVRTLPVMGSKQLLNVTVQGNKPFDVSCAAPIMGSGILTTESLPSDFEGTCDLTACDPPGPMCGAP